MREPLIVPTLDAIARDPAKAAALPAEDRGALIVRAAAVLAALGVDLVVLDQQIDTTTPSGRLLFHVLAAIAEFERDLIRERVKAGLERAKAKGVRLGRPLALVPESRLQALQHQRVPVGEMARQLGVSRATVRRRLRDLP